MQSTRITNSNKVMKSIGKGLLSLGVVAGCLAAIPAAAQLGLLILGTAPNPRHPPGDVLGEAVGWAVVGALAGGISTVIGESITMLNEGSFLVRNKGLILGSTVGIVIAVFLGMNFAVLQMDSVDGQAITSVNLGIMAGATVSMVGAMAGVVIGATVRRIVLALMS